MPTDDQDLRKEANALVRSSQLPLACLWLCERLLRVEQQVRDLQAKLSTAAQST